ncbi:MAG TPA: SNF2-related protein [Thermoanaerobaculaceae bacterium]|nr:SNF2-related protein [Thermoanaerobaculaceae bacterium]HRS15323.1 SNF2-related protein [Thermoanaerobaculaceae bacterium]
MTLREGATPFRSLGRVSIRPRTYQFVPLLMALRLDPVRVLIADDVGVGKTVEALLIARELRDRGEVKRICVLCPPYLCDQWQQELATKFNLEAVVIRSGTVNQLDRLKGRSESIYQHFPVQVASIDFLKSDRNKHLFLLHCPDLVIVDEAHGAVAAAGASDSKHQRHALVRDIAALDRRHLLLLTATPHSGIEGAFRELLALLRPEFGRWNTQDLGEPQRIELARHFVQRTRKDIETDWEGEHCFPRRDPVDETYRLSPAYADLFDRTYDFCSEIVTKGAALGKRQQRVRSWGALALLRCVMSSPAAAVAALKRRHEALPDTGDEVDFGPSVFESSDDRTDDEQPTPPIDSAEATLPDLDRRRLRELGRAAAGLIHSEADFKLAGCAEIVGRLLKEGFHPIVWCRYIATAEYVARGLERLLRAAVPTLRATAITSRLGSDEERRTKLDELAKEPHRVLVATDCLSEGINLQESFTAALHYDLPWNPNRLEQREGRVDRYGQTAKVVKTIRYFSPDNPVDGVVIDVLLNKAREIHQALGTHVPVPEESESVTEAVLNALFLRGRRKQEAAGEQLRLDFGVPEVETLHRRWERDAERERINRTRFAQRAIKPEEVRRELEATDEVLGDPAAVRTFVLEAAQRLDLAVSRDKRDGVFKVAVGADALAALPEAIKDGLPRSRSATWLISFDSPTPEGAEYLGRNHRFVASLARFLMEEALTKGATATASRCAAIRTRAVATLTTIALLRVRYLVQQPDRAPLLSEEVRVVGYHGPGPTWLSDEDALRLLAAAKPDANLPMAEKRELIADALGVWPSLEPHVHKVIRVRAAELEASHKRIRQAVFLRVRQLTVEPQLPPDLLGLLVLQPMKRDSETGRLGERETNGRDS